MQFNWLITVTAGRWQANTIKRAKQQGIKIIAIDSSLAAEGFEYADLIIIAELDDVESIKAQIGNRNICGVLSICSEAGMILAGKLRDYYHVSTGPNLEVSQRLVNKALQRTYWQQENVTGPKWLASGNLDQLFSSAQTMALPFMIKPADSAGSRGVVKVEHFDDNINNYLESALSLSKSKQVIIEDFMDGVEYTVEGFVHQGKSQVLVITEKDKIPSTHGLVAYRLQSAILSEKLNAKISQLVIDAVTALNYKNGPFHAEVIVMKNGNIGMVELAGRGGGFLVFERFVQLASGVDIVANTINQAIGKNITPTQVSKQYCILHFFPNEVGTVNAITGFEEANLLDGVEGGAFIEQGTVLTEAKCDGDRMGYVISYSDNETKSKQQLQKAISLINFKVTK
ncbi:ATP-grasp domain-containing protein [Colwellia asteriadis]|uniref:ATP-grasp domain-containing protein n=1 Tax=Colwellia asteriadis TaxID=517723 RepID=A0ABP3WF25_9GAMM